MNAGERARALLTARLLRAASTINHLSTGLTLLGAAALLFTSLDRLTLAVALVAGLASKWFGVRIGLDAALFEDLVRERVSLEELDEALTGLKLAPAKRTARSLTDRCLGARRLIVVSGVLLAIQVVALAAAAFIG